MLLTELATVKTSLSKCPNRVLNTSTKKTLSPILQSKSVNKTKTYLRENSYTDYRDSNPRLANFRSLNKSSEDLKPITKNFSPTTIHKYHDNSSTSSYKMLLQEGNQSLTNKQKYNSNSNSNSFRSPLKQNIFSNQKISQNEVHDRIKHKLNQIKQHHNMTNLIETFSKV